MAILLLFQPVRSAAWGPEGHAIVGRVAMHFLKEDIRQNILRILGNMPVDTAANWMDIMRSNSDYDFMKPWHFVEFAKGKEYVPSHNENIMNRLFNTYGELKHKNTLCEDQVRFDLLVLMHLIGDLHTPLHVSYDDDPGGNTKIIQYDTMKTHNLHKFWDEDIISFGKITSEEILSQYSSADMQPDVDFIKWMNESRNLLPQVYDFPGYTISAEYLAKNVEVVKRQLFLAGMRLAAALNKLFYTPAPLMNMEQVIKEYKDGIDAKDALQYVGKKVTACARVYAIRASDKITQINVGDKFPNNPLTIVIFAKSYQNFKTKPEEMYKDKNICVKGKIETYQGKAQIVVEQPEDIIIKE